MIHKLRKIAPSGLDAAVDLCRRLVAERMQAHFNGTIFDVGGWYDENALAANDPLACIPEIEAYDTWFIVMLTLMPHVYPSFFESIIMEHLPNGGDFPEIGGVKAANHRGMLPTGETLQFILAGSDISRRLQLLQLFGEEHFFYRQNIIWLEPVKEGEPVMSGRLVMSQEWVDKILLGKETAPRFGLDFPAKKITTGFDWADVVLHPRTMNQVRDIGIWLLHQDKIRDDANLGVKIRPGTACFFTDRRAQAKH